MPTEDQPNESSSLPPGCSLWAGWLAACLVGEAIGWYAGWRASFLAPGWLATLLIGAIMGAVTGGSQAVVLHLHGRPGVFWFVVTTAGWATGFSGGVWIAQSFGLTGILFGLAAGSMIGLLIGFLQWAILQRWVSAAFWWIPASIFSWSTALIYYQPGANALGLMYGAVVGIVTGTVLLWLLYRPTN